MVSRSPIYSPPLTFITADRERVCLRFHNPGKVLSLINDGVRDAPLQERGGGGDGTFHSL